MTCAATVSRYDRCGGDPYKLALSDEAYNVFNMPLRAEILISTYATPAAQ